MKGNALRCLFICEHYYPHVDPCSKRVRTIVERMQLEGHHVEVVAADTSLGNLSIDYVRPEHVHFYSAYPTDKQSIRSRFLNHITQIKNSRKLALRLGKFDAVVCTSPPLVLALSAMKVAKRDSAKFVLDIRDIWPDVAYEMGSFSRTSIFGRLFEFISQKAYRSADAITVVSEGKKENLLKRIPQESKAVVELIPNGLDLDFVKQETDQELIDSLGLDSNRKSCVYIGNIGLAQGLEKLLSFALHRPDVEFLIFGSGSDEENMRRRVKESGLQNVQMHGRVSTRQANSIYRHATCAFIPLVSSALSDSIPTKLYEALGSGCPVFLMAAGDSVAILDKSQLGKSIKPEDFNISFEAFDYVIDKAWTSQERQMASEFIIQHHSRQSAAVDFEKLMNELVAKVGPEND